MYTYNAVWLNSCGSMGMRPAAVTVGSCPPRLAGPVTPGPEAAAPPAAEVGVAGRVAVVSGPNSFTPAATITQAPGEGAHVRLTVYDVLGRVVAVLVDEEQGTYLYRPEAGTFTETKPMAR